MVEGFGIRVIAHINTFYYPGNANDSRIFSMISLFMRISAITS